MKFLREVVVLLAGVGLGLLATEPFDDYVKPFIWRTHAEVSLASTEPLGREVMIKAKVSHVASDNSVYVVVKSGDRYWPQATLNEHFDGEVQILLGSTGPGDVGNTFLVQVLAVSSAANSRIQSYLVNVGDQNSPFRHTGIDFIKVESSMRPLATIELTRKQ